MFEFSIGHRPMKHPEFHSISDASLIPFTSRRRSNAAPGYFACLIDALDTSRRLQAAGVMRQHHHLIHEEHGQNTGKTAETKSIQTQVPRIVPGTEPDASKRKAAISLNAKLLIAITVAAFGILHMIANGALRHPPAPVPTEDSMPLPNRD
jgi:hypothetical protein